MHDPSVTAESKGEPDLSGRRLGDYQLMRRLARGGMADIYLAEQQSLRRQVAFKVLRKNLAVDEIYVRRFHNEAQAAAALVHANIVQIYEVGCIDGVHFIAQEYVRGQNLKQLINRRGSVKVALAVNVMRQVAAALYRASARGIIHRDIKPENIMLASTGEVKVADFGLARVAGEEGQLNLTQVGVTLGTPLYMSPEQVEGRQLDPRSDLYSFGVTCYEMLAGRPPFTGDTALSVAVQHLKSEPPRLEDVRHDLPVGLCRIVHQMLAKKPSQRYQDAAELLRDLRSLKIEGMDDDWTEEDEPSEVTEMLTLAKARTAATQQLATVMMTESHSLRDHRFSWWWVLLFFIAFPFGTALAWAYRPASLLQASPAEGQPIERKATAADQFRYAMELYSEPAFKAVENYFPPDRPENETYVNKARLQLAYIYMDDDAKRQDAVSLLEQLARTDSDWQVQARALVALINFYAETPGEKSKAQPWLLELTNVLKQRQLSPGELWEWTQSLDEKVRTSLDLDELRRAKAPRSRG